MSNLFKNRLNLTLLLIGLSCLFFVRFVVWKKDAQGNFPEIITSDGIGYYSYLPNIFINHSIAQQEINNRHILPYKDRSVNKYYVGTAIAMSPFFIVGGVVAYLSNEPLHGFSEPFQQAISVAAIFYMLAGLFFLMKLLKLYQVSELKVILTVLTLFFGTNLFVYTTISPSMSHVYSFAFIAAFLYYMKKFALHFETRYYMYASSLLAMVVLIRPIDGLVILAVPFLAGSTKEFKAMLIKVLSLRMLILGLTVFFGILSIQFLLNYIQTGEVFIWNYQNEGFYFSEPEIINVLFSFRKGFFIYTPLMIISFVGMILLIRKNKFAYLSLILFFSLFVYITSCWWNWYYGPSFGQRPFVDFFALNGLVIGIFLDWIDRAIVQRIVLVFALICVILNLIQSYQYKAGIISAWDMNFAKYRYTFLKISPEYIDCLGGNDDAWLYKDNRELVYEEVNKSANYNNAEYNLSVDVPADERFVSSRWLFAEVQMKMKQNKPHAADKALFVLSLSDSSGVNYHYYTFKLNEVPTKSIGEWHDYTYNIGVPNLRSEKDKFQCLIWNKEKKSFLVKDFQIRVYTQN